MHYEDKQMANKTWFDWQLFWSEQVEGRKVRLQTTWLDMNVSKFHPLGKKMWLSQFVLSVCSLFQATEAEPGSTSKLMTSKQTPRRISTADFHHGVKKMKSFQNEVPSKWQRVSTKTRLSTAGFENQENKKTGTQRGINKLNCCSTGPPAWPFSRPNGQLAAFVQCQY